MNPDIRYGTVVLHTVQVYEELRYFDSWEDRNQALHGNTAIEKTAAIRRDVRQQLEVIYKNRHLMDPSVQSLLHDEPEDHDRQQLTTTQMFKESIRRVRPRAIQNVRSIVT